MSDRLHELVKEFWALVDRIECSDSGTYFQPTRMEFSSCRVMDGARLGKIIEELRTIVDAGEPVTDKTIYALNNPDGCKECLGEGCDRFGNPCKFCKGSGSTDPAVCRWCKGTGDMTNHERYTDTCLICKGSGRVLPCPTHTGEDCKLCNGFEVIPDDSW